MTAGVECPGDLEQTKTLYEETECRVKSILITTSHLTSGPCEGLLHSLKSKYCFQRMV